MMRWILYGAAALAFVAILIVIVGAMLPKAHSVSRTARVALPPAALYALLTDVERYPSWRPDVTSLQRRPDRHGMPAWIEGTGGMTIPMVFEHMEPQLLVARIDSTGLPFGGTWTYRIQPLPGNESALTITEDGEVSNVFFRFMSRFVFGHYATMDAFIRNLQARAAKPA
jgi:Polyketide cyclase / dehydrase and lipid transport